MVKNLFKIRKIAFGLLLLPVGFQSVVAQSFASLARHSASHQPEFQTYHLLDLLKNLEKRFGVIFDYNRRALKDHSVTVRQEELKQENLEKLLRNILAPLNLTFEKNNEHSYIIYLKKEQASGSLIGSDTLESPANSALTASNTTSNAFANAYALSVKGKVVDNQGESLPGVSVVLKGTTTGTSTAIDGTYALTLPDGNGTLVFSFIGYAPMEVLVNNRTTLDITLSPDVKALSEVVVVGYGTQKKIDVTGAVGTVSGADLLKGPANNALQGLQGKVAGVNVFLNSGAPTSSPRVIIRGAGTLSSSTNPLYVVDGVVMEDIQFLNPNDIESMDVLKDASSTSIYGARGANGVILITTRRGGKTDGITIGYDAYVSVGQIRKKMDLLDANEWLQVVETGFANTPKYRPGKNPVFTKNDPRLFDANGQPLYNTDWQDEATRTAVSHNHQLSVQNKAEKSSFGVFMNYAQMQGIMLNSWLNRLNGKVAYDANPKKWLSLGVNLMVNTTKENAVEEGGGGQVPRRTMIEMPPIFPVKFPDGSWSNSSNITDQYTLESMANPVHVLETQERLRNRTQLFGNTYLTFHLLPGLDLRTQFGFDKHDRVFQDYSPTDLINISSPQGYAKLENQRVNYWQEETYLSYNKQWGLDHRVNAVLGLSWQERVYTNFSVDAQGFSDNFFKFNQIGAASKPGAPQSGYEKWAMNSYFLRTGYTFRDKYMVTLTGRVDGSSRFGANNKYGFFPSLGLGWVLSNEPFMQEISSINELKLRSSYGVTGNTELPPYASLATVSSGTVLINGVRASDSYLSRLPNPNLKWERTTTFDVGVNMAFFKRRLALEVDYYNKLTTDILLDRPVPHTTGFTSVKDNIGSVSNKGLEVMVTTTNVERDNFNWQTTLNFNYNRNRIEKLGENNEDIESGPFWVSGSQTILRVGQSVSSFWGYERLGIWSTAEAAEAAERGFLPGEAKRSVNKKILGKGLPDWTGSFINTVRYKDFDLSLNLQFVYGVDILQEFFHSTEDRSGIANGLSTILTEGWTPQNQNTMVQEIRHQGEAGQNSEIDSHWIADGSYLRANLISLGYNFKADLVQKLNLKGLRVYASVQNAFVIHSKEFKGYDPEATSWGNEQWGQNMVFFQYPKPRTYTLGVNVKF